MDEQPDGLAAYVISLQPGAPLQLPELHGDGRLVSVLDGAIEGAGERYTYRAWGYANRLAGETFNAGGAGASLLCLDYPAAGHAGARFIRERRSDE
jgi:hypothetical protein